MSQTVIQQSHMEITWHNLTILNTSRVIFPHLNRLSNTCNAVPVSVVERSRQMDCYCSTQWSPKHYDLALINTILSISQKLKGCLSIFIQTYTWMDTWSLCNSSKLLWQIIFNIQFYIGARADFPKLHFYTACYLVHLATLDSCRTLCTPTGTR